MRPSAAMMLRCLRFTNPLPLATAIRFVDRFCDTNGIAFDDLYRRVCALEGMLQMSLVTCATLTRPHAALTVPVAVALDLQAHEPALSSNQSTA